MEEQIKELKEFVARLEYRIEELELANDYKALSILSANTNLSKPDLYRCIELGIAEYFDIDLGVFYQRLLVGNKFGSTGSNFAKDPENFSGKNDKIIVAKNCLYAILHIDFHIPIPRLCEYYNVNVANYIKEWKNRYIRIFEKDIPNMNENDEAYRKHWVGCFESCVRKAHELGFFEDLKSVLSNSGYTPQRLLKWRIND